MEFNNIEIHNIGQIVTKDQGVTWLRVPLSVYEALESDMVSVKRSTPTFIKRNEV